MINFFLNLPITITWRQ